MALRHMEYVYVVHRTDDGKTATVVAHCAKASQAQRKALLNDGGWEGPYPANRFPVGSRIVIETWTCPRCGCVGHEENCDRCGTPHP